MIRRTTVAGLLVLLSVFVTKAGAQSKVLGKRTPATEPNAQKSTPPSKPLGKRPTDTPSVLTTKPPAHATQNEKVQPAVIRIRKFYAEQAGEYIRVVAKIENLTDKKLRLVGDISHFIETVPPNNPPRNGDGEAFVSWIATIDGPKEHSAGSAGYLSVRWIDRNNRMWDVIWSDSQYPEVGPRETRTITCRILMSDRTEEFKLAARAATLPFAKDSRQSYREATCYYPPRKNPEDPIEPAPIVVGESEHGSGSAVDLPGKRLGKRKPKPGDIILGPDGRPLPDAVVKRILDPTLEKGPRATPLEDKRPDSPVTNVPLGKRPRATPLEEKRPDFPVTNIPPGKGDQAKTLEEKPADFNWRLIDDNRATVDIAASRAGIYQRHADGKVWKYTGTPKKWELIDDNPRTKQVVAAANSVYQRHDNGTVWEYTGTPIKWKLIDQNPATVDIVASGTRLYQRQSDGKIWEYTGTAIKWSLLDDNRATVEIAAATGEGLLSAKSPGHPQYLYQRHGDGKVWKYGGAPKKWELIDDNRQTKQLIAAANSVYQRHDDGTVWEYTGTPIKWKLIDDNRATVDLVASGPQLYQRHAYGTLWEYNGTGKFGWKALDNNPGTIQMAAGRTLYQRRKDGTVYELVFRGPR